MAGCSRSTVPPSAGTVQECARDHDPPCLTATVEARCLVSSTADAKEDPPVQFLVLATVAWPDRVLGGKSAEAGRAARVAHQQALRAQRASVPSAISPYAQHRLRLRLRLHPRLRRRRLPATSSSVLSSLPFSTCEFLLSHRLSAAPTPAAARPEFCGKLGPAGKEEQTRPDHHHHLSPLHCTTLQRPIPQPVAVSLSAYSL